MNEGITEILDGLAARELLPCPWREDAQLAKQGDLDALWRIAYRLELGLMLEKDLNGALKIYEWLADQHADYGGQVIRVKQQLSGQGVYPQEDMDFLMAMVDDKQAYAFVTLTRAFLSGNDLASKSYNSFVMDWEALLEHEEYDTPFFRLWYDAFTLDPRTGIGTLPMLRDLAETLDAITDISLVDPILLITYLECVTSKAWVGYAKEIFDRCVAILSELGLQDVALFYQGRYALIYFDYENAFRLFGQGKDRRCQLGLAYCYLHGFGTEVKRVEAGSICDRFLGDPFALYMQAVIAFRSSKANSVPAKVRLLVKLAEEAGSPDANFLLGCIKAYYHLAKGTLTAKNVPAEFYSMYSPDVPDICGAMQFCGRYFQHHGLRSDFGFQFRLTLNHAMDMDFHSSAIYGYLDALVDLDEEWIMPVFRWIQGLCSLGQSGALRKHALEFFLVMQLVRLCSHVVEDFFDLLVRFGWDEKEVELLKQTAITACRFTKKQAGFNKAQAAIKNLFLDAEMTPLRKLEVHCLRLAGYRLFDKVVGDLPSVLKETEGIEDSFIQLLRGALLLRPKDKGKVYPSALFFKDDFAAVFAEMTGYAFSPFDEPGRYGHNIMVKPPEFTDLFPEFAEGFENKDTDDDWEELR